MKGLISAAGVALAAIGWLTLAAGARGDEKAAYPELVKMFEAGWGSTGPFRTAADQQAAAAFRAGGRGPRLLYAVAVVHIKQGRYADAQKLIDEVLTADASHLPALRARVWLTAMLRNYGAAMVAAEKLAEKLPAEEGATSEAEDQNRALVQFLGRMYGFLGGPVAANVKIDDRKASERKIAVRLTEARRAAFEEARDGVLQKHLELLDARDAQTDAAKEAAEDAKAKTLEEIAEQREERAARLKELQARSDKLKGELKDELAQIAKEDRPLVAELAQLERRAASVNRELFRIQNQISGLQNLAENEDDPVRRQLILSDIDRLVLIGSRYDADLVAINRLAAGVQSQRAGLAARQQKAEFDTGSQLDRIQREANELAKREKRDGAIARRTERATPALPASAASLRVTAAALATYDPFPLEQEKARILAELK